jgi:hypothetical protein
MADANLEMSDRNDTMAAHRGVVAVVELVRRDSARRPMRRRPLMRDTALRAAAYSMVISMQLERRRVDREF